MAERRSDLQRSAAALLKRVHLEFGKEFCPRDLQRSAAALLKPEPLLANFLDGRLVICSDLLQPY